METYKGLHNQELLQYWKCPLSTTQGSWSGKGSTKERNEESKESTVASGATKAIWKLLDVLKDGEKKKKSIKALSNALYYYSDIGTGCLQKNGIQIPHNCAG